MIRSFSAAHHQLLNSNLPSLNFAGWHGARDSRVFRYSTAHYNQSHMILLSLWVQWPIRGIQMSHRWNSCFIQCERSLNEFCSLLISNQKQQSRAHRCAYYVSKILISQCKQLQWLMGVFDSAWILAAAWLKSMIMCKCYFALFLYNKQGRIYLLSWHRQNDMLGLPSLLIGLYNSTTPAK